MIKPWKNDVDLNSAIGSSVHLFRLDTKFNCINQTLIYSHGLEIIVQKQVKTIVEKKKGGHF